MTVSVDVVIVHRNRARSCLATVASFRVDGVVEVIVVVDNGSTAGERDILRHGLSSEVEVIELGENAGFGPAANAGLRRWLSRPGRPHWCAVAPHDAHLEPGTLARLASVASERPELGLVSADVGDGGRPLVDHVFGPVTAPPLGSSGFEPTDYPHGTLLLARRECLAQIGLFDERYFAYCEEADLGLRARAAGWDVGLVRGASVVNREVSNPLPVVEYLKERNTLLLMADHFGRHKALLRAGIGLATLVRDRLGRTDGDTRSIRAHLLAVRDALTGRWGPPPRSLSARPEDRVR